MLALMPLSAIEQNSPTNASLARGARTSNLICCNMPQHRKVTNAMPKCNRDAIHICKIAVMRSHVYQCTLNQKCFMPKTYTDWGSYRPFQIVSGVKLNRTLFFGLAAGMSIGFVV